MRNALARSSSRCTPVHGGRSGQLAESSGSCQWVPVPVGPLLVSDITLVHTYPTHHTMASYFTSLLDWLRGLFFTKSLEITLLGLQNAGQCGCGRERERGAQPAARLTGLTC